MYLKRTLRRFGHAGARRSARLLAGILILPTVAFSQDAPPATTPAAEDTAPAIPSQPVDVRPEAEDAEIARRLEEILSATPWFGDESVEVNQGVVFLRGTAETERHRTWAEDVAQRTQDVVAVVNLVQLTPRSIWDFSQSLAELNRLWRITVQSTPLVAFAVIILVVTGVLTWGAAKLLRRIFENRMQNSLLRGVAVKVLSSIVLLLGIYIVLRVAGLTRLAVTVLGGTGLAGLVIGIAFRDIMENFLASLLISIQTPFRTGDVIEIEDYLGVVQKVTTRGTLLMAFNGNYIQIPNSTVYKSIIRNHTASRNTRFDFLIGIAYDSNICSAQEAALQALAGHPMVLKDPEPMVLVEGLGPATIGVRVYFWMDVIEHSPLKVKSSVMRLVLRALERAGIALPDEAREVIFPKGVPVNVLQDMPPQEESKTAAGDGDLVATAAEGDLKTEKAELDEQVRQSRMPEEGVDLLAPDNAREE